MVDVPQQIEELISATVSALSCYAFNYYMYIHVSHPTPKVFCIIYFIIHEILTRLSQKFSLKLYGSSDHLPVYLHANGARGHTHTHSSKINLKFSSSQDANRKETKIIEISKRSSRNRMNVIINLQRIELVAYEFCCLESMIKKSRIAGTRCVEQVNIAFTEKKANLARSIHTEVGKRFLIAYERMSNVECR